MDSGILEDEQREQDDYDRTEWERENHPMYQDAPDPEPRFGDEY
jgi:hypothetical protein